MHRHLVNRLQKGTAFAINLSPILSSWCGLSKHLPASAQRAKAVATTAIAVKKRMFALDKSADKETECACLKLQFAVNNDLQVYMVAPEPKGTVSGVICIGVQ